MYNEQLEKLIEMALMDGELTDKERTILSKKAESFGVDIDEFEMVLEARLFEKKQADYKPTNEKKPESNKFGDMKKCPACGSPVQSLQAICSDCGHEFRNIDSVSSISDFFREYKKIEESVKVKETGGGLMGIFDDSEGDWHKKVFTKKKEFIMHFPIPNSKEDILEFLMMALPLAKPAKTGGVGGFMKKAFANFGDNENKNWDFKVAEVWAQKCEQIIMKAKFSMKEDKKVLEEIMNYAKELGIK